MRLTVRSDYSLRVLIFLAAKQGELATIPEIAKAYGISRGHLMKVVHELAALGYVATTRGRNGGLTLGKPAESIRIGEVVRHTEETLALVECFSHAKQGAGCRIDVLSAGAVEARFATLLVKLFRQFGDELADGTLRIGVPLSRQELADLVSTSFETAIRVLSRWEREGTVATDDDGFTIGNWQRLLVLSDASDRPRSSSPTGLLEAAR